jgi:hypothetical protein
VGLTAEQTKNVLRLVRQRDVLRDAVEDAWHELRPVPGTIRNALSTPLDALRDRLHEALKVDWTLKNEIDDDVDRMQTPRAKEAVRIMMKSTPEELGDAAIVGATSSEDLRFVVWSMLKKISFQAQARKAFWERVRDWSGLGSKHAMDLCTEFGFDQKTGDQVMDRGWEPRPPECDCMGELHPCAR